MATSPKTPNQTRQGGVRNSNVSSDSGDDWTVFNSMREFWLWAIVISMIIVCVMVLFIMIAHVTVQVRKAELILERIEHREKKNAKARTDPKPDSPDGL